MAWGDSFYRKASAKIEAQIGEPVEVIGWASRSGAMGAVIAGKVVGGAEVAIGGQNSSFVGIPGDRMKVAGNDKASTSLLMRKAARCGRPFQWS